MIVTYRPEIPRLMMVNKSREGEGLSRTVHHHSLLHTAWEDRDSTCRFRLPISGIASHREIVGRRV